MDQDERDPAIKLLTALHVSSEASQQIIEGGKQLRTQAVSSGVELAAIFDLDTGAINGSVARGSRNEVEVSAQFEDLLPGRRYLAVHTHPRGTPFSLLDVKTFIENSALAAVAVITSDGRWFILSRTRRRQPPPTHEALVPIARAYSRLRPIYKAAADAGTMTSEQALSALLHHVWRVVSREIGLRL